MLTMRCSNCKGYYESEVSGGNVCPTCKEKAQLEFQNVHEYIRMNKGVSLMQVSKDLGISHLKIKKYLEDEKLEEFIKY